jgi:hypothetical protein
MSMLGESIAGAISGAVAPIVSIFTKKTDRKAAKDAINGQVAIAKLGNEAAVSIQASDWEIVSKSQESGTWKDEYITLSVFTVFNAVIIGSVASAFGYDGGILLVQGVLEGVKTLDGLDGNVGRLMMVVAYAGLSIKFIRDVVK